MDIKTAFPNRELCEEIYIKQPAGLEFRGNEKIMCYLDRPYMDSSSRLASST